jgi:hypothetical protein
VRTAMRAVECCLVSDLVEDRVLTFRLSWSVSVGNSEQEQGWDCAQLASSRRLPYLGKTQASFFQPS